MTTAGLEAARADRHVVIARFGAGRLHLRDGLQRGEADARVGDLAVLTNRGEFGFGA
ncbi:hypothetical protein ACIHCX_12955 [Streptomyces sp. NPDC052043]|uniref:hypothetical protein n=1 Tax=Streptomyces sp. NPDC052043 TaxID=3365684 RepID=UPI0037D48D4C